MEQQQRLVRAAGVAALGGVLLAWLRGPLHRFVTQWIYDMYLDYQWRLLPERIVMIRHGEAEHNLDGGAILQIQSESFKPDNLSELTRLGVQQAERAGERLREVLGPGASVCVVCSPFERTQQTLCALRRTLGEDIDVRDVHIDPRVREQEFGNWQNKEDVDDHREMAMEVGRFWYRRPTGESGADVYDRATTFWDSLLSNSLVPHHHHLHRTASRSGLRGALVDCWRRPEASSEDALVVVTHGLTMRVLLMRYFNYSPQTFDAIYNPGNCDMWTLRKSAAGERRYDIEPEGSSPQQIPWATRQIRLTLLQGDGSKRVEDFTIVHYLALPQPRTSNLEAALRQCIPGHGHNLDPSRNGCTTPDARAAFIEAILARCVPIGIERVAGVDWWCGKISMGGMSLRTDKRLGILPASPSSRNTSLDLFQLANASQRGTKASRHATEPHTRGPARARISMALQAASNAVTLSRQPASVTFAETLLQQPGAPTAVAEQPLPSMASRAESCSATSLDASLPSESDVGAPSPG